MALPEETKVAGAKSAPNVQNQKSEKREKPLTKIVIRRLPPAIDKETFLNQISPVPSYDYIYLVNGEAALGENSFARVYINFVNSNDVFTFKEKFDNYVFLDNKGNEYAAVVEFAAFQKIPKKRNKARVDPKCGSIESDPYYLEFVENLNKPVEQEDKPEYSYQFLTESKESKDLITTPLLEFVKSRRVERMRIREERREERRKKELERKKMREEERKRRFEERSPTKVISKTKVEDKDTSDAEVKDEKRENNDSKSEKYFDKPNLFRNKERKFEDRKKDIKIKPSPRKEYPEKREFKSRKEYFKEPKYETYKKVQEQFSKKVKKYSEKREERKIEAQRAEMKKAEERENKAANGVLSTIELKDKKEKQTEENLIKISVKNENIQENIELDVKIDKFQQKEDKESIDEEISECKQDISKKNQEQNQNDKKEYDNVASKEYIDSIECKDLAPKPKENKEGAKESRRERIRNKDRPTIAIYRPGMLSKRKLAEGDTEKESIKEVTKEVK